jgi:signal transduction histidine kinase
MKHEETDPTELTPAQNTTVERKNIEIEAITWEGKADQLLLASKYKSEFLANMSHELRTPLNSLLVLSELLSENDEGNLTKRQIEFAETIHSCGQELLALINDILDLAKIESGKMVVDFKQMSLTELKGDLERTFSELAKIKGLEFRIEITQSAAQSITTDGKRLNQILKNLLSNALKFTGKGSVYLLIDRSTTTFGSNTTADTAKDIVSFTVTDSGIGIAKDKQKIIFEPFQQADGTTNRNYGGTGLGLAICIELATLLGGQLTVESELGKGSSFSLHLPASFATECHAAVDQAAESTGQDQPLILERTDSELLTLEPAVDDDRLTVGATDLVFLVIEQDLQFAEMVKVLGRQRGFKTIIAGSGTVANALVEQFLPHAISLDLKLANGEGWTTLEFLRRSQKTRQIPLQLVSVDEKNIQETTRRGTGTKSRQELLDETSRFLDRALENL